MCKIETSYAARQYYANVIKHSWTWERLTQDERMRFVDCLDLREVTGSESTRKRTMQCIYRAFLAGLGYDGFKWRENEI